MKSLRSKSLALLLSILMVFLMGTMHVSMASHVVDHAHHSGTTHSTGVCAWMCMAAQSISADSPSLNQAFHPLGFTKEPALFFIVSQPAFLLPSRAPPL